MSKEGSRTGVVQVWSRGPGQGVCEVKTFLVILRCYLLFFRFHCLSSTQESFPEAPRHNTARRWMQKLWRDHSFLRPDLTPGTLGPLWPFHVHPTFKSHWTDHSSGLGDPSLPPPCVSSAAPLHGTPSSRLLSTRRPSCLTFKAQCHTLRSSKPVQFHHSYLPPNQWDSLALLERSLCSILYVKHMFTLPLL